MKATITFTLTLVLSLVTMAQAKPPIKEFEVQIVQVGKVATPDSKGVVHLQRAPFELIFSYNFEVAKDGFAPIVKLHLSTDSDYYDTIRAGNLPWVFTVGACDIAEQKNPPSDNLVVSGKMPPLSADVKELQELQELLELLKGLEPAPVHLLVSGRFNDCTRENGTRCVRKVKKLSVGEDNVSSPSQFPEVDPKDFPEKPIYISAVSYDFPKKEWAKVAVSMVIQFSK